MVEIGETNFEAYGREKEVAVVSSINRSSSS